MERSRMLITWVCVACIVLNSCSFKIPRIQLFDSGVLVLTSAEIRRRYSQHVQQEQLQQESLTMHTQSELHNLWSVKALGLYGFIVLSISNNKLWQDCCLNAPSVERQCKGDGKGQVTLLRCILVATLYAWNDEIIWTWARTESSNAARSILLPHSNFNEFVRNLVGGRSYVSERRSAEQDGKTQFQDPKLFCCNSVGKSLSLSHSLLSRVL